MIKIILAIVMLSSLYLLVACSKTETGESADAAAGAEPGEGKSGYKKISPEEAKAIMEGSEEYILLDVRTDDEFKEKHIDGAVLIPDYEISDRAEAELTDKDALILVYCRSGRRSALAAKQLVGMGYARVYDFGGIIDWSY